MKEAHAVSARRVTIRERRNDAFARRARFADTRKHVALSGALTEVRG
jgi:hypothetical protein